jgi:hypothetical protein
MQVWDLRKTKVALEVQPFEGASTTCAAFDHSGKYLVRAAYACACACASLFLLRRLRIELALFSLPGLVRWRHHRAGQDVGGRGRGRERSDR